MIRLFETTLKERWMFVPFRLIANMFALYHTLSELDLVGTKEIDENLR